MYITTALSHITTLVLYGMDGIKNHESQMTAITDVYEVIMNSKGD